MVNKSLRYLHGLFLLFTLIGLFGLGISLYAHHLPFFEAVILPRGHSQQDGRAFASLLRIPNNKVHDFKAVQQRRLFKLPVRQKPRNIQVSQANPEDGIKNFSLVGVLQEAEVVKAVVEDRKTHKTYFLKEGDRLGDAQLVGIKDNEIVLQIGEHQFSLLM